MGHKAEEPEFYAMIVGDLPVGLWVARAPDGEFLYSNAVFREIMGIEGRGDVGLGEYAEPYGIHDLEGALYPEHKMPFVRALDARTTVTVDDIVIHRPDGQRVNIRAHARPVLEGDAVSHVVIAFTDITREVEAERERLESQERMRQTQRLEAIGNLAGGIAHDFNNLLGAIRVIATTLAQDEADPDRRASLDVIEAATVSARELTRTLLDFAGEVGSEAYVPLQIDDVVQAVTTLLDRALDARYALDLSLSAPSLIRGDRPRLEQVVMNLVINARDAMPSGGRIWVRTEEVGDEVFLHVQDEGPGVPPELRDRVFDPYFSTRPATDGHGIGLGLATVYGIVTAHGGEVGIADSEVGAHLWVRLPADHREATADRPAAPSPERVTHPSRVLVVDDDPLVRGASVLALTHLGYQVTEAASGPEALDRYRSAPFDAVMLDQAMPQMDGRETLEHLRALDPQVRVLIVSGYALNRESPGLTAPAVRALLQKPYGIAELAEAIATTLR